MFSSSDGKDLGNFPRAVKLDFHDHLVYPTNISYECDACGEGGENDERGESGERSENNAGGEIGESNEGGESGESSENGESEEGGKRTESNTSDEIGESSEGGKVSESDESGESSKNGESEESGKRSESNAYGEIGESSEGIEGGENDESGESGYICKLCDLYVHKDCLEINNPYRHKHPLKLLDFDFDRDYDKTCLLCGQEVKWELFYHCFLCDITLCILCSSIPLFIDDVPKKVHEHSLTQVMIKVSFTCDACGVCGDGLPCVCLPCCFIIHRGCIKLPRVIHVNRHDHRVSHTYSLGIGDWVCGVCRKGIDRIYGAYSCSICRYAVHSKCATRIDVWDGVELEDVPEDDEDLDPFEVIGEGVIKHFLHEHHLRLIIEKDGNISYCYACCLPIYCDPCYACIQCRFVLHEACANLPKKLRHEIESHQLTLCVSHYFVCDACDRRCTGFCYKYHYTNIDVRCAKVSKTFNHGSHPHLLFSISTKPKTCTGCRGSDKPVMSCIECDFDLCFYYATLPKEVRHKYDRHPLSLCYGENAEGLYWCEICERETNPNEWFYTCNDCGSTLHVNCVLGNDLHVRPGHSFTIKGEEFEGVANDRSTRPICLLDYCKKRCVHPFVFKSKDNNTRYLCDYSCMRNTYA